MKIACLGWGSLIWKPGVLPLASQWFNDGPELPIEFSRVSDGGELATAVCLNAPPCQVLWALLNVQSLDAAVQALREREQIPIDRKDGVGIFTINALTVGVLGKWAADRRLDAVIWTALPPRFDSVEGLIPSLDDVLSYLIALDGDKLEHAKFYMESVPEQIDTPYRQAIKKLGWD
jgi:hypothetical protein